jgi:endonuclease/exonuclease/phosphatase family metal-dependent hydrolase
VSPPRLRVMTYNVRAYRDDWRAAAEVIARVEPDVLCLQEVSTARRVTVASVHLSLVADERLRHVELIRTGVPSADQLVIAGDINEDDAGAAWRILGERGWTRLVSPLRPTFPAGEPVRCLDAVFASPGLVPVPAAAGREPGDTDLEGLMSRASDHRPLWVDLTHTKPRAG